MNYRIERDSMGEVRVPQDALFGAQTQRAVDNFGLSERRMPTTFIHSLAMVKSAAAGANVDCGVLEADFAEASLTRSQELEERGFWFRLAVQAARLMAPVQ